jgi:hypothetical protein
MRGEEAAKNALKYVFEAVPGERVIIICDDEREGIGLAFAQGALNLSLWTRLILLDTPDKPRTKIPRHLLEALTQQKPDIYINVLRGIREEIPFRIKIIKLQVRDRRVRLGHCPGVTLDMLTRGHWH